MWKKKSSIALLGLFLINALLLLYKSSTAELRGDEAASLVTLVPFIKGILTFRLVPTILVYFHEPLQLILQVPSILFGLSEFYARFNNIVCGIFLFFVLYKIGTLLFEKRLSSTIVLLSFYTISGFFLLSRLAINIGVFALLTTTFLYFFIRFIKTRDSKQLTRALICLGLAVFTYLDALFLIPGLVFVIFNNKKLNTRPVQKILMVFFLIIFTLFASWAFVVYLGSILSAKYLWIQVAPFRLILRGGGLGTLSLLANFNIYSEYTSKFFSLLLITLATTSTLVKKNSYLWTLFIVPILWFNLIKDPTVHLLHFYPFVIILAASGWDFISSSKKKILKLLFAIAIICTLTANLKNVNDKLSNIASHRYKEIGQYVQSHSNVCDYIYTNVDGYVARLYFGRRYQTDYNKANIAILERPDISLYRQLTSSGFQNTKTFLSSESIYVLFRPDNTKKINTNPLDNYFSFNGLLPYTFVCK